MTEFLKAKSELEDWLQRAHGTVKDCVGVGDRNWVKDKMDTINLVTNRITEGIENFALNKVSLIIYKGKQ